MLIQLSAVYLYFLPCLYANQATILCRLARFYAPLPIKIYLSSESVLFPFPVFTKVRLEHFTALLSYFLGF